MLYHFEAETMAMVFNIFHVVYRWLFSNLNEEDQFYSLRPSDDLLMSSRNTFIINMVQFLERLLI